MFSCLAVLADADSHVSDLFSGVDGIWIYFLVFFLILVQEIGVPLPVLPSEVILLSAGFLASHGKIALVVMGAFAVCATLIGNSFLYFLGRRFGRAALDRFGKYIMLRPERIDRIETWIDRRGTPILMYGPLLPVLRAYVPALAGIFGVPYRLYICILAGAALTWTFGMLILGQLLGDHWWDAVMFFRHNLRVGIVLVLGLLLIACLATYWKRRFAHRSRPWRAPQPAAPRLTAGHDQQPTPAEEVQAHDTFSRAPTPR